MSLLTEGNNSHLDVIFNEACRLDSSLHVETDVHLHVSLLVCQLDDWHLVEKRRHLIAVQLSYNQLPTMPAGKTHLRN